MTPEPPHAVVGGQAPPFELPDAQSQVRRLEDYRGHWLLLVFHRHLGCLPCRRHLLDLKDSERIFQDLDVQIVVVSFMGGPVADAWVREMGFDWPVVIDETRTLYAACGMFLGTRWNVWGPRTCWAYIKELFRGRTPRASALANDIYQLGGDVLVDPSGIVRLLHRGSGPADRPSIGTLLTVRRSGAPR